MKRPDKGPKPDVRTRPKRSVPWPVVRTVLLFGLFAGLWFWGLTNQFLQQVIWLPFVDLVAMVSGGIFKIFGATVNASGRTLTVDQTTLSIAFGCDGLEAHGIYIAAILASTMAWRRKLWGLLIGAVGIFAINQIRVCGIFLIAEINHDWFYYAHTVVGQTFVIIATMALFLWWESRDGRKGAP